MELLPLLLLAPLLVAAVWYDLRRQRVPDTLCLAAMVLFLATLPFLDRAELTARAGLAAVVCLPGYIALTRGYLARGDVGLLGAVLLFVPQACAPLYGLALSAALAVVALSGVAPRRAPRLALAHGHPQAPRGTLPIGLAVALSGLALPILGALR